MASRRLVGVRDEAEQARYIVEQILENREGGAMLKQQAVLFRTSSHSGPLEVELTRRNIPFVKFGGLKFLEASHIKDLLALLRFTENPRDYVAGFRLLHLLPGVGSGLGAARRSTACVQSADPLSALAGLPAPPRAGADWRLFVEMAEALRDGTAGLASRAGSGPALVRTASGAHPRGRRGPPRRPHPARTDRRAAIPRASAS